MLMMIMNYVTSTGSQNFTKHLTNKDSLLVPKNVLQKERLHIYCATVYARSGVNQMWILKNSKELLENLKYPIFSQIYSIKTYDFPYGYLRLVALTCGTNAAIVQQHSGTIVRH
jgi:hypothetical protein